jgi:hypothetical protein
VHSLRRLEFNHRMEYERARDAAVQTPPRRHAPADDIVKKKDQQAAEAEARQAAEEHNRRVRRLKRQWEDSLSRLHNAERHHAALTHDLHRAPAQVIEEYQEGWPYVVVSHRLDGRAAVRITLAGPDGQPFAPAEAIEKQFHADDTTIDPPNPAIGLLPKHLNLPDDQHVREKILSPAADDAAALIIRQLVQVQSASLAAHAATLEPPHDTELRIRAAVLLESIDPARARGQLAELRREVTGQ